MGCNCGKSKNINKQSSRINRKIENVNVPPNMNPNQRRTAITKVKNVRKAKRMRTQQDWENYINENL
tara:strand:- start:175 stop:375 length:201 start_codon:yes stop_codon:yes gene_type:complete